MVHTLRGGSGGRAGGFSDIHCIRHSCRGIPGGPETMGKLFHVAGGPQELQQLSKMTLWRVKGGCRRQGMAPSSSPAGTQVREKILA